MVRGTLECSGSGHWRGKGVRKVKCVTKLSFGLWHQVRLADLMQTSCLLMYVMLYERFHTYLVPCERFHTYLILYERFYAYLMPYVQFHALVVAAI